MLFLRSLLHTLWMVITVIPYTLGVLLARVLGLPVMVRWRIGTAWLMLSVHAARWFCGIRYRVQGLEHLPTDPHQGVVLLAKHQSTFETFLLPGILPRRIAYVFKKELLSIPFFGWSIGSMDMIHIDRKHGSRAFHKVVEQGKRLLGEGVWVAMFPEGTRVGRGEVGDYKSGAARLACMCGVPVVPVAITSARCWPRNGFVRYPGTVEVSIGQPIPTTGRKHDELTAEVQRWIEAEMRRLDPRGLPQGGHPQRPPLAPRCTQGMTQAPPPTSPEPPLPPFTLVRSARRSLGLEISASKGLVVRAPLRASERQIQALLHAKAGWIRSKLSLVQERQEAQVQIDWHNRTTLPFGRPIAIGAAPQRPREGLLVAVAAQRWVLHLPCAADASAATIRNTAWAWWLGQAPRHVHRALAALRPGLGRGLAQPAPDQCPHPLGQRQARWQPDAQRQAAALPPAGGGLRGGA